MQLSKVTKTIATSTALFNSAYERAESQYAQQVRLAGGKQKETDMYKLRYAQQMTYLSLARTYLANAAYRYGNDIVALQRSVDELCSMHQFNAAAQTKMQTRMGWSSLLELPLVSMYNGDVRVDVMDKQRMLSILSDKYDLERFVVNNSSQRAIDLLAPLTELVSQPENIAVWEQLRDHARNKAARRLMAGQATRTDRIILKKAPMTVYMVAPVLSRYLGSALGALRYTEYQLSYRTDAMNKAIKEAAGLEAQHRDYKVSGYSDLSKNEKEGYYDESQVESIRQQYMEGDDERGVVGIETIVDSVEAMRNIEQCLLDIIHESRKVCKDADTEVAQWAYVWVPGDQPRPITDRDEAMAQLEVWAAERRERNQELRMVQRDDEGRYMARSIQVPTFELDSGYEQ